MNARMLRSLCALSLIPLVAGCCCQPAPRRHVCRDGSAKVCRPHAAPLASGRLHVKDRLAGLGGACLYGFPPYVPVPPGYMLSGEQFSLASTSRHVEIHSVIERPQAPRELPGVADETAKPLAPDDTPRPAPKNALPPKSAATDEKTTPPAADAPPKAPKSDAVAQPSLAPRTTAPKPSDDKDKVDAPSPDEPTQPVSVPPPATDADADDALPNNPLHEDASTATESATTGNADGQPAETSSGDVQDAPEPKSDSAKSPPEESADEPSPSADDEAWPDAPLPKNDLPPLAPAS